MNEPEDVLVERAMAGDKDALGELLRRYIPALSDRLKGTIGPAHRAVVDPDDVLQVTCMEAFLGIAGFRRHGPEDFFRWLLRIAQNNVRDAIRGFDRDKREPRNRRVVDPYGHDSYAGLLADLAGSTTSPSGHVTKEEQITRLKAAITTLPELYQQAINLVDLEGRIAADAAATIGKTPGAIHMARHRARQHLARLLTDSTRMSTAVGVKSAAG